VRKAKRKRKDAMNNLAVISHGLVGNTACEKVHAPVRPLEPTEHAQMNDVRDIFREYAASLSYSLRY